MQFLGHFKFWGQNFAGAPLTKIHHRALSEFRLIWSLFFDLQFLQC